VNTGSNGRSPFRHNFLFTSQATYGPRTIRFHVFVFTHHPERFLCLGLSVGCTQESHLIISPSFSHFSYLTLPSPVHATHFVAFCVYRLLSPTRSAPPTPWIYVLHPFCCLEVVFSTVTSVLTRHNPYSAVTHGFWRDFCELLAEITHSAVPHSFLGVWVKTELAVPSKFPNQTLCLVSEFMFSFAK
jgi:hypothetical protein